MSVAEATGVGAQASYTTCHQALDIIEVLEEILTHLPTKDLLFAQAVSSRWKKCIEGSNRLQRGLFFQIPKDKPPTDLTEAIVFYFSPNGAQKYGLKELPSIQKTAINPLLHQVFYKDFLIEKYMKEPMPEPRPLHLNLAMARPEASWRRMHFCYPELTRIEIDVALVRMLRAGDAPYSHYDIPAWKLNAWNLRLRPVVFDFMGDEMLSWMQEFETASQLESHYAEQSGVEDDALEYAVEEDPDEEDLEEDNSEGEEQ